MVANTSIPAGAVILTSAPLLLYPSSIASLASFCSGCFRSLPPSPTSCASCHSALFCSAACAARSHPSLLCLFLSRRRSLDESRHQEHFFPSNEDELFFVLAAYSLPKPTFDALFSAFAFPAGADVKNQHRAAVICSALSTLNIPSQALPAGFSVEVIAALLAIDKTNAFALPEPFRGDVPQGKRGARAYGLYPDASMFNHDCLPNACHFDYLDGGGASGTPPSADIVVRALHDIPEGREVCLSYFAVNWRYKERQRKLLEDYGFRCECDRCRVESEWKDDDDDLQAVMEDDGQEGDEAMEEETADDDNDDDDAIVQEDDADFPHAYFFARFLCSTENCGGTMAPLPPTAGSKPSNVMECNVCGRMRKDDLEEDEDGDMADG